LRAWLRAGELHLYGFQGMVGPEFARVALRASDDQLREALHADLVAMPEPAGQPAQRARQLATLLTGPDYEQVVVYGARYADDAVALGDRWPAMNALEEAAVAAAATDRKDTARVLARRAATLAADSGAVTVTARLNGRLRALGVRLGSTAPRARPRFGWESLTDTERRIVDLVAAGTGGPDIARRLHLSPRTVQTHVSHALTKLGLSNRVELAAAAAARSAATTVPA
jgi:DNA-binding CsgD family transcriptional regulator